jgi:phage terminase small subunit
MEKKKNYKLTPKQEKFAMKYIELSNASEAYRQAYDTAGMTVKTLGRKAKEVIDNGKVTAYIESLQKEARSKHMVTVESIAAELEEARKLAMAEKVPSAAVSASLGKAKIYGLDKKIIELSGSLQTRDISEDELAAKLSALGLGRFGNQLSEKSDDDK